MISAPCKGCEGRYPGCHVNCESYVVYSRERAEMLKSKKLDHEYYEARSKQAINALWRKRKKEKRR